MVAVAHGQIEDFATTNFTKADSVAQLYPQYSLRDMHGLARKLSEPLSTDVEKFRAIYLWTCLNIENDYYLFRENQIKRARLKDAQEVAKWNKKFYPIVMEALLKKHRTVCTGYAYLIRELALHAGLSCVMIDGYGRTSQANVGGDAKPNHSWNAVRLNGKWYLCDATWSSGAIDMGKREFSKSYNDTYFLLEPHLFIANHYPVDSAWTLTREKPTLLEFLQKPLVYSGALQHKIYGFEPETFTIHVERGRPTTFRFKDRGHLALDKVELQIKAYGTSSLFPKEFRQTPDGYISVEHVFTSRGHLILHLLVNGTYVSSYTVDVD
jgi:hypothetical protein